MGYICAYSVLALVLGMATSATTRVSTETRTPPNPIQRWSSPFASWVFLTHSRVANRNVQSRDVTGMGKSVAIGRFGCRGRNPRWLGGCVVHSHSTMRRKPVRVSSSHPVRAIHRGLTSTIPVIGPDGPLVTPSRVKMQTVVPTRRSCLVCGGWYCSQACVGWVGIVILWARSVRGLGMVKEC